MTTKLMQSPKRQRCTVGTSVSVVEKARKDFEALDRVAREYRADGLDVIPRRGAQLAWDAIVPFLTRRESWPRAEALSGPSRQRL